MIISHQYKRRLLPVFLFSIFFLSTLGATFWVSYSSYNQIMEDTLRRSTESSHGDMVLFASSSLRNEIADLIETYEASYPISDWDNFSRNDQFVSFNQKLRELFSKTHVLKLKIYASDGYTIFSTDPSQIGDEKSEVEEVTHALRGRSSSQFSFRERFMALSGDKKNLEVVSSYHPLVTADGIIRGVVEIYSDRSPDFLKSESNVLTRTSYLLISIALSLSVWLTFLIYIYIQRRSEDY